MRRLNRAVARWWLGAAAVVAAGAAIWFFAWRGGGGASSAPAPDSFRYHAVKTVSGIVTLIEKPDARRVYLADGAPEWFASLFMDAGCLVFTNAPSGRFDIVVTRDSSRRSFDDLAPLVAERGVLAWVFDTEGVTIAALKAALKAFPAPSPHLWMPGEATWVLAGRPNPRKVKLSAMLEVFAWEALFGDLVRARCTTIPEVFASYSGDRPVIEGALDILPPEMPVSPEVLTTKTPPGIDWIADEDTEADIIDSIARDVRTMQSVRRQVLEGNMLSKIGRADDAIEKWHLAYLRNPNDTMLLERLYRLGVNARACREVGNVKTAAKCYETIVCINPQDTQAIMEYATCLRSVGQIELADEAMKRAKELRLKNEEVEANEDE